MKEEIADNDHITMSVKKVLDVIKGTKIKRIWKKKNKNRNIKKVLETVYENINDNRERKKQVML